MRGPEAGLRLKRLRRNEVEELDGRRGGATARRWSPSTTLTSPACSGRGGSLAGPAGAEEPIRNMADARRRTIKAVYEDPRAGFGSIAQTLQQAQVRDPSISKKEVKAFLDGLRVTQRGYNSFVPLEPKSQPGAKPNQPGAKPNQTSQEPSQTSQKARSQTKPARKPARSQTKPARKPARSQAKPARSQPKKAALQKRSCWAFCQTAYLGVSILQPHACTQRFRPIKRGASTHWASPYSLGEPVGRASTKRPLGEPTFTVASTVANACLALLRCPLGTRCPLGAFS